MGFIEVHGQNHAVKILKSAVKTGRISHSYLFYGTDGVGKNKTATIFAQLLNCERRQGDDPCGECDNCRKIKSGNHPDLLKIEPDGAALKISQMRKLQEKAYYRCYEGRFKVIMIDDAHLMTIEAANCLLKILEEPPEDTVFILMVEDTKKLPSTILSRTQAISFVPLDENVLADILVKQGIETSIPLSLARGSAKRALELVRDADFQQLLHNVIQLMQDLKHGGYQKILGWSEILEKDKSRTEIMLNLLATIYRDRLVRQAVGEQDVILKAETLHEGYYGKATCCAALEEINKAHYFMLNNGNTRLILDVLFLKLHQIEEKERGIDPVG